MATPRKRDSAALNARVAVEARTGHQPRHEFARTEGVPPSPITPWKPQLEEEGPHFCSAGRAQRGHDPEARHAPLSQHIGHLKVALD